MATLQNLSYRIKRFFDGESGIVIKIEPVPSIYPSTKFIPLYHKDDSSNLPMQLTIKNDLGELVTRLTPLIAEKINNPKIDYPEYSWNYKTYKPGDKFP